MHHPPTTVTPAEEHRIRLRGLGALVGICVLAVSTAGCLRGQAQALPEVPLDMPAPPERMVEVNDPQEPPPIIGLPEEPVPNTPVRARPAPPTRTDARPAEVRPDVPEAPRPPDDSARPAPPPALQTAPAQQEGEAERRVRTLLAQATGDLNRINVQSLNADARQQFDTARRFVTQAEDALRSRNVVFATNLAEKAAALAAQLFGR